MADKIKSTDNENLKEDSVKNDKSKKSNKGRKGKKKFKNKKPKNGTFNDPSWYTIDSTITKQVANIPFNTYLGRSYTVAHGRTTNAIAAGQTDTVLPGILIYKYIPVLNTNTPNNSVEITSRALYQYVRQTNSGAKNYEAVDMMMYVMAMDSVYLALHQVRRVLRLINTYLIKNKYVPKAILDSLGCAYNIDLNTFAQLIAKYNVLVSRANSFAVPAEFNLFKRRAAMGLLVFSDEKEDVTQITVPWTDTVYYFDSVKFTQGGALIGFDMWRDTLQTVLANGRPSLTRAKFESAGSTSSTSLRKGVGWTVESALGNIQSMLNLITFDEDMNTIAGDIMKAYQNNTMQLTHMESNETLEFTHDPDFLKQFETATVLDVPGGYTYGKSDELSNQTGLVWHTPTVGGTTDAANASYPTICQENGMLINSPRLDKSRIPLDGTLYYKTGLINAVGLSLYSERLLSVNEEPSPEKVLEWTRLLTIVSPGDLTIMSGIELGLGFFTVKTQILNGNVVSSTLQQWFQSASDDTTNDGQSLYFDGVEFETYIGSSGSNKFIQLRNRPAAWSTVQSMTSGPRRYPINRVVLTETPTVTLRPYFTNLKAHNALLNETVITMLHDTAIYALLAIPIMKK